MASPRRNYTSFLNPSDDAEESSTSNTNPLGAQAQTSPQAKRALPFPLGPQGLSAGSPYMRTADTAPPAERPNKKMKQVNTGNPVAMKSLAARKSAIPATLKDAGPHDRMLWQWKLDGKSYLAIGVEWEKLTGEKHGDSFFSVRFMKLKETFAENNALDLPDEYFEAHPDEMYLRELSNRPEQNTLLLELKEKADEEMAGELWRITARKWEEETGETIDPRALHQRWTLLRGGDYSVSPDEETAEGDGNEDEDVAMQEAAAIEPNPPRATRSRSTRRGSLSAPSQPMKGG